MTGEEYMNVLLERQAAYETEHSRRPGFPPLLEWFIRPGDEELFTPPPETRQPKKITKPRTYRSAASLVEERDRLAAKAAPLVAPLLPDRAASHGKAIGVKGTARIQAREDSRLRRYVELNKRIRALESRIARATARERKGPT